MIKSPPILTAMEAAARLPVCIWCDEKIWPWQHYGFVTKQPGCPPWVWHKACRDKYRPDGQP